MLISVTQPALATNLPVDQGVRHLDEIGELDREVGSRRSDAAMSQTTTVTLHCCEEESGTSPC